LFYQLYFIPDHLPQNQQDAPRGSEGSHQLDDCSAAMNKNGVFAYRKYLEALKQSRER
jgi:hypothetical protein